MNVTCNLADILGRIFLFLNTTSIFALHTKSSVSKIMNYYNLLLLIIHVVSHGDTHDDNVS